MALKAKVTKDEFTALPELIQKEYKPIGEADAATEYLLDAEGVEDVTGLKNNSQKLLNEKTILETKLREFQALGDPVKAKEAVKKIAELEEKRLREEGDFKKIQEQTIARHAEEMLVKDGEIGKLNGNLSKLLIDNTATAAITAAKGKLRVLLPHVKAQMKVVRNEATGEPEAVVVDASGTPRIASGSGARMTVADLVGELQKDADFGGAFEASGSTGGGARSSAKTGTGGAKTVAVNDQSALNTNLAAIAKGEVKVVEAGA